MTEVQRQLEAGEQLRIKPFLALSRQVSSFLATGYQTFSMLITGEFYSHLIFSPKTK